MKIYYSVANGGDGSAYPRFFDTNELAEWHQEHLLEGWGEPCTGDITIEGTNIVCKEGMTKVQYYLELLEDEEEQLKDFVKAFFPDGLPKFEVTIVDEKWYGIKIKGSETIIHKSFSYPNNTTEEGRAKLETELTK